MTSWWRIWEGIISEYWDGSRLLTMEYLGGDVRMATVMYDDYLLVAIDRIWLHTLDDDEFVHVSWGLRHILSSEWVNRPGATVAWRTGDAPRGFRGGGGPDLPH